MPHDGRMGTFNIFVKEHGEPDETCEEIFEAADWEAAEQRTAQWVSERRHANPAFEWAELRSAENGERRTAHWGPEHK